MTSTARTDLPTDLVALVSFDGRVYANAAMTLDRVGTLDSPSPLEAAFEQWFSFATGRHTFISVKGPTLRGLVSARKRSGKLAWEIDCLIDADGGDSGVLLSLLDQVTDAAGRAGAFKIFLRLPSGNSDIEAATRCAFAPYRNETVYRAATSDIAIDIPPPSLRRRAKPDLYPLFQLYNEAVPEQVRRYEAATFGEWSSVQESLGRTAHWVLEDDGRVTASVRIAGDGDIGRFDIAATPEATDAALDAALHKLQNRPTLYALVPEHQPGVRERLEARGFTAGEQYTVLARRTVRPVKAPKTVPAVVQTTFG